MTEPTPNADEALILTHLEEITEQISGLLDSVKDLISKIGRD